MVRRWVGTPLFEGGITAAILANAVILGAQTYSDSHVLDVLNVAFIVVFAGESLLRLAAVNWSWRAFAKDRWNVFDAVVVLASIALVPLIGSVPLLLRLVRLVRVVRIMRYLPDLRIAIAAVWRSLPGVGSLAAGTALLVFVYGMVGVALFGADMPEQFGNVGDAMLTMFVMLTLENLPETLTAGMAASPLAVPYFISYAILASFLVFNLFIGLVINAMEKARDEDQDIRLMEVPVPPPAHAELLQRLDAAERALSDARQALVAERR